MDSGSEASHVTSPPDGGPGSPDWETARRVEQFNFSIELFERNYADLEALLQYLEAPIVVVAIAPLTERWRQHVAMREITYRLHNYVASAQSLIDHARVLCRELYEPTGRFADYPNEAVNRFATNPLAQFVRMLRNMAQHYRLPSIQLQTSMRPGPLASSVRGAWLLKVADLRQWSGWNPPAEQYLAAAGETIDIHRVVADYHGQIMSFYDWFRSRQSQIHGAATAAYSRLLRFGTPDNWPQPGPAILGALSAVEALPAEKRTFGDLVKVLLPALTELDEQQLRFYQHDPRAWVARALQIITSRFGEIPGLRDRLMAFVTQPP